MSAGCWRAIFRRAEARMQFRLTQFVVKVLRQDVLGETRCGRRHDAIAMDVVARAFDGQRIGQTYERVLGGAAMAKM